MSLLSYVDGQMYKTRTGLSCGNRRKRKQTARSGDHSEAEETTWNSHTSGVPFPFFQLLQIWDIVTGLLVLKV